MLASLFGHVRGSILHSRLELAQREGPHPRSIDAAKLTYTTKANRLILAGHSSSLADQTQHTAGMCCLFVGRRAMRPDQKRTAMSFKRLLPSFSFVEAERFCSVNDCRDGACNGAGSRIRTISSAKRSEMLSRASARHNVVGKTCSFRDNGVQRSSEHVQSARIINPWPY